jgi:DNA-binding response OmpR family regulator
MIVVLEDRQMVADAYVALFQREGVAATGLCAREFGGWITAVSRPDLASVEAFLVGECQERASLCRLIQARSKAVVIVACESRSLDETLDLFAAGVDDVVRKPVHVREILARVNAVARRAKPGEDSTHLGEIKIFFDGRDPEIRGERVLLPRRERRILEYLAANSGCRVTKAQIFSAVYGLFNEDIDENVIESHVSKLRKRLRARLGYDPIDSKRFLGYRLLDGAEQEAAYAGGEAASSAQVQCGFMAATMQLAQDPRP